MSKQLNALPKSKQLPKYRIHHKTFVEKKATAEVFSKDGVKKSKNRKKEILHFIASSMVDVETMFKLSIVL